MSSSAIARSPRVSRPDPTLRYGDRFGSYLVNGFAGVGATSYVYRARKLDSFDTVAIKVLHPHLLNDRVKRGRFQREAEMMMQFRHSNIVRFYEIVELPDDGLAFVMEYIDGVTLEEWLETEEAREADEITLASLFVDVLRGLHHTHRFGVIHRDLKPANILITRQGDRYVAKIIDFGVARFADKPVPAEDKAKIVGTAAYISPEEVRDPDTVCEASDLYSIGVMMFEAACGTRPFEGRPVRELMDAHAYEAPPSPRKINPLLTPAFESVIMRTLTKTPEERFTSAPQMIGALETAIRTAMEFAATAAVAQQLPVLPEVVDESQETAQWSREELLAMENEAARFVVIFRQAMMLAFTLLLSSGMERRQSDPHHLHRVSSQLPIL